VEEVLKDKECLWWERSAKDVRFRPEVKEWGSYKWPEWPINRGRRDWCRKR